MLLFGMIFYGVIEISMYIVFALLNEYFPKADVDDVYTRIGFILWLLYAFLPIKLIVLIVIGISYCCEGLKDKWKDVSINDYKWKQIKIKNKQSQINQDGKLSIAGKDKRGGLTLK